jgi:hypothetical protein
MKRDVMERVLSLCPRGHKTDILVSDAGLLEEWDRTADRLVEPEGYEKWHGIAKLPTDGN